LRRGRRAGEVVDLVDLVLERVDDVVPHELEARVILQVGDVELPAGEEVIEADDLMAVLDQAGRRDASRESRRRR